jgi:hypothetical protein
MRFSEQFGIAVSVLNGGSDECDCVLVDIKDELLFVVCQERRRRAPLVVGVDAPEDPVVRPLIVGDLLVFFLVLGVALLVLAA